MSGLFQNAAPLDERITEAVRRITHGLGSMRIPAEATDPDIVLGDCRDEIAALRARVDALTGDRDAATARAERAVGVVNAATEYVKHYKSVHSMSLGASMAHAERMGVLLENLRTAITALLAIEAGKGE